MMKTQIRQVWRYNIDYEFSMIRQYSEHCQFASLDTEFPGVIYKSDKHPRHLTPEERYYLLKKNVCLLKIIQLGLTLSDKEKGFSVTWEFNFCDFDEFGDAFAVDSIELLRSQGIDFHQNRLWGINSRHFGHHMWKSGLLAPRNMNITWITFHGSSDFAYLMKILLGAGLPETIEGFSSVLQLFFGKNILDMKYMMKFCENLYGGLDKVASALNVERETGMSHQAGSDSLLTWQVYEKMTRKFFRTDGGARYSGVLFGLHNN